MPTVIHDLPKRGEHKPSAITRPLAAIEAVPIRWLWPNRIARGKVTIVAGDPKLGKSLITADLAARISAGRPWPDNSGNAPVGSVIFASAEDDPADTIRPRIEAAGGDVRNVHVIESIVDIDDDGEPVERFFNLRADVHRLRDEIERLGDVVAVIIDPVTAYLGGADSHKNAEVRELLAPLAKIAAEHNVAVIAVSHLNKSSGTNALYRVSGSLAFTAAARSCWLVAKDPDDDQRRLMLPAGTNIAPDVGGLAYRIATVATAVGHVPVLAWEPDPVDVTAVEALAPNTEERTERDEAADWLRELLADGPMTATQVQQAARAAGFNWRTVHRARKQAGVETERDGFGRGATYFWKLRPAAMDDMSNHGCQPTDGVIHGDPVIHEQLRSFPGPMDDTMDDKKTHGCQPTDGVIHGKYDGDHTLTPAALAMPSRPELDRICRRAVADFPDVDPDRLRAFLEAADDPEWATEPAARQLARRMSEGLITWMPGDE